MNPNSSRISLIYTGWDGQVPEMVKAKLQNIIDSTIDEYGSITVFFRADDIGPPSANYSRMMDLFVKYRTPLCLAVVPSWMTRSRWETMLAYTSGSNRDLFCWHMHGYRHKNHETEGKKQEFGPSRAADEIREELLKGYRRLESVMGDFFFCFFTPPWNRCSFDTMVCLEELGFKGISRSHGGRPHPPERVKDLPVLIDLHTRKEESASKGWDKLLEEFRQRLGMSPSGIMLHHMRMNDPAFVFLEYLLELFSKRKEIFVATYRNLV